MSLKHELQDIISGNGQVRHGKIIQTIATYLRGKKKTISDLKETKFGKVEETKILVEFINNSSFWYPEEFNTRYIGEGAEQRIYESNDPNFVLKLNDAVFYEFWFDYLNSLLLHNYFFPHLA